MTSSSRRVALLTGVSAAAMGFAFPANAQVSPGTSHVVVAPSVWWKKHSPDRRNANNVTSQRVADLGGGATFYDCRVEVERVDPARA